MIPNTSLYMVTVVLLAFAKVATADLHGTNDPNIPPSPDGNNLTRDTEAGLDWLDFSLSDGRSYNDVSTQFGAGGDYEGFRFATTPEMHTLFDHAGLVLQDPGPNPTQPILDFLSLFGTVLFQGVNISGGRFDNQDGNPALVGGAFVADGPAGGNPQVLVGINSDGLGPQGAGPLTRPDLPFPGAGAWLVRPSGDFNADRVVDATDIDLLSSAVRAPEYESLFDLDGNGVLDQVDRRVWVEDAFGTLFGDADLDKTVVFADFLLLSSHFNMQGGWADGDFDGNGDVQFADFLLLSANFNKSATAVAAVPEPSTAMLLLVGLAGLVRRRGIASETHAATW